MSSNTDRAPRLLAAIRQRRTELRASMGELERVLASPPGAGGSVRWAAQVKAALMGLYDDFAEHVAVAEGPDGLYAELSEHSPRLTHAVAELAEEHREIRRRLEELLTWVDVTDQRPDVLEGRRTGTELLVVLMRHRQRGADLVFEAYALDIGGET